MKKPAVVLVLLLGIVCLVPIVACGGKKKAKEPLKDDDSSSGFDPDKASANADDGGAGSSTPPTTDTTPTTVSCLAANGVCSELSAPGPDAAAAKDKCGTSGGAPADAGCARDDITATCVIDSKNVTLFYYKAKSPESKSAFKKGEASCKADGGTWTPTKVEKPAPKGKPKGKPKKK